MGRVEAHQRMRVDQTVEAGLVTGAIASRGHEMTRRVPAPRSQMLSVVSSESTSRGRRSTTVRTSESGCSMAVTSSMKSRAFFRLGTGMRNMASLPRLRNPAYFTPATGSLVFGPSYSNPHPDPLLFDLCPEVDPGGRQRTRDAFPQNRSIDKWTRTS